MECILIRHGALNPLGASDFLVAVWLPFRLSSNNSEKEERSGYSKNDLKPALGL